MSYFTETGTWISDDDAHELFDDFLDEIYGDVEIGGSYPASHVLQAVDPIAYRVGFSDWIADELDEERLFDEDPTESDDDDPDQAGWSFTD